ncbi:MAG: DUF134 domain-containing protein [Candidatus Omnitrophota bacterium]
MKSGRPKKVRFVQKMPKITQFSPRGKPGRPDEIELAVDEFEAFKLADYQGFNQTQGAAMIKLSRPSFGRILRQARKKVADALVNGKVIKIRTGDIQVGVRKKDLKPDNFEEELLKFKDRQRKVKAEIQRISAQRPGSFGNSDLGDEVLRQAQ